MYIYELYVLTLQIHSQGIDYLAVDIYTSAV